MKLGFMKLSSAMIGFLWLILFVQAHANAPEFRELAWQDLMPEGWEPPEFTINHQFAVIEFPEFDAPVVPELNKQKVKVPGFIIPIEYSDTEVTEFLLVPFVGACIHVPPPPENQMVYVKLKTPLSTANLWDPVWVKGVIKTERATTVYTDTGYTMDGAITEKYVY